MNIKSILILILCTTISVNAFAESRCDVQEKKWYKPGEMTCSYSSKNIASSSITSREVQYQVPLGEAPAGGWPVVVIFQGSIAPVKFDRQTGTIFGLYHELETIKNLLDNGYAVIAPRAQAEIAYNTNMALWIGDGIYHLSPDFQFFTNVFQAIRDGEFGPINADRKYATGMSSGGYNTSRMAVSFPGEFKALVIQSGSYAECANLICVIPALPEDHPPTFFLHGWLDTVAPWSAMDLYYDRLLFDGIDTDRHTEYLDAHRWSDNAPELVLAWFELYQ